MKNQACQYDRNDNYDIEKAKRSFLIHFAIYLIVVGSQWKVWLFSGMGYPFPIWVTFFWGIGVYSHFKKAFGLKRIKTERIKSLESEFI